MAVRSAPTDEQPKDQATHRCSAQYLREVLSRTRLDVELCAGSFYTAAELVQMGIDLLPSLGDVAHYLVCLSTHSLSLSNHSLSS